MERVWIMVAADVRRRIPVLDGANIRLVTSAAAHSRHFHTRSQPERCSRNGGSRPPRAAAGRAELQPRTGRVPCA